MKPTTIALVGIAGYGAEYLTRLLNPPADPPVQLVAGIDPFPERSPFFADLQQARVPLFPDLESFYRSQTADLVIIAAPIHLHAPLACLALSRGSNVLCEKPLAATLDEARKMLAAEEQSGKRLAIGYQWSYSDTVLSLKRDILAGRFGRPLGFKTLLLWSRSRAYYQRSDWAGRVRTQDGAWVLDSPVNNATAHYLHNMLFLLGSALETSARPEALQAELYRANPIENYDTAALRVSTAAVTDLLFLTAHPVLEVLGPLCQFEFEEAVVEYPSGEGEFQARFRSGNAGAFGGRTESYGSPDATAWNKLWHTVEVIRSGGALACDARAALPHLICVAGAQKAPIVDFPKALILLQAGENDQTVWVSGLAEAFKTCFQANLLPSESGAMPWAAPAAQVDLQPYAGLLTG